MSHRFMLATFAAAAGLTVAVPAMAQSETDSPWNGWYLGVNLGGNWGHGGQHLSAAPGNGAVVIPPADISTINSLVEKSNPAGFSGGIEGGYNYSYRSSGLVLGLETDFGFFNLDQKVSKTFQSALQVSPPIVPPPPPPTVTITQSLKTDWIWTVRPRIGWRTGRWLLYGTGGMALADVKQEVGYTDTFNPAHVATFSKSATKVGWAAGLGAGFALTPNWSLKAEWIYTDLGTLSASASTPNGYAVIGSSGKISSNIIRAGVDYRF